MQAEQGRLDRSPKAKTVVYWIVTALFSLQMSFTAYAQLRLPQVAEMFTQLGFPAYLLELSWAKLPCAAGGLVVGMREGGDLGDEPVESRG